MKTLVWCSIVAAALTFSGCTTFKQAVGKDSSGMHQPHAAQNDTAPVASRHGVLVDSTNQMTLYTFDNDVIGQSNCGKLCLVAWPAFLAPDAFDMPGQFSTIQRADGKYQWAINGKPLYFYANDIRPGDKNGGEKLGKWHVVISR